ncbi:uncharacterized protein CLUP02_00117 [Colletotrichum lupini]|uniref:Uncharacterized protein n=1 Tax=Colletotrichum lupini TaxID=145971 RepID=A0A9Q8SBI7_9PEZI|nr:uncharacterized protein CLUP02_00117 [Colletotrichum lupini]UQC73472.1 hypothetical protein CLUP02_00117 [Colletotrichum lupini]
MSLSYFNSKYKPGEIYSVSSLQMAAPCAPRAYHVISSTCTIIEKRLSTFPTSIRLNGPGANHQRGVLPEILSPKPPHGTHPRRLAFIISMADGVFGETMELLSGEQSQYSADDLGTGYNSATMLCRTRRPACGWEVDVAGGLRNFSVIVNIGKSDTAVPCFRCAEDDGLNHLPIRFCLRLSTATSPSLSQSQRGLDAGVTLATLISGR